MKERFAKLAALTRGATVLTLSAGSVGGGAAGCTKSEPASATPIAAASAQPAANDPEADPDGGLVFLRRRRFPIPNAMHPGWRHRDGGEGPEGGGTNGDP
jgi:hypothetical protein